MKRVVILIITIVCATEVFAQKEHTPVRRFEIEPGFCWNGFFAGAIEARYNFVKPWDIGARAYMDWYGSAFDITADYNLSRGADLAFFFGAGAGLECVSNIDYMGVKTEYDAFHLMPRVGIEMFRHLRFTLLLNTYNFKPNDLCVSIGYAFGGGTKAKKNGKVR
jgi:hypothetical protein